MCTFQQEQTDFPNEFLSFYDNLSAQNTLINSFYHPEDFIYTQENTQLLPHYFDSYPQISLDEFEFYQYPKRAKFYDSFKSQHFMYNSFDGSVGTSCREISQEFFSPAEFQSSKKTNGVCLSAQSVADRQRRKKISVKTQELGKLIPAGNKMNTAEMFQVAFKYVKYLQAQVGILQFMSSIQESKDGAYVEKLHGLVTSPRIQEKLYEEEKCMVPKEAVETLAKDQELQSNPSISKILNSFLHSLG
ncbi:uncharacterized protein LOC143854900 [Tasmannia lanceolata]|uniref:uncharacterized protein LOC143854900 n=1 Tax=Tasmannia lanceolata TaxID=3420 RepID=UPI0040629644